MSGLGFALMKSRRQSRRRVAARVRINPSSWVSSATSLTEAASHFLRNCSQKLPSKAAREYLLAAHCGGAPLSMNDDEKEAIAQEVLKEDADHERGDGVTTSSSHLFLVVMKSPYLYSLGRV